MIHVSRVWGQREAKHEQCTYLHVLFNIKIIIGQSDLGQSIRLFYKYSGACLQNTLRNGESFKKRAFNSVHKSIGYIVSRDVFEGVDSVFHSLSVCFCILSLYTHSRCDVSQ